MHQSRHIGESPPRLETPRRGLGRLAVLALLPACGTTLGGCKASVQEIRGKTSFGPEFRNRGNNTSEIRYDARQAIEVKWDNGWTTGVVQRYREIDNGAGDQEFLTLFEVGYPIWKPAKKPEKAEKSAQRMEDLEGELAALRATVAGLRSGEAAGERMAKVRVEHSNSTIEKESDNAKP